MDQGGVSVAAANIVLGVDDRFAVSVAEEEGRFLSDSLVRLKGECMKFLGDYLVRQNTPLEEPDEVLGESVSEDEEGVEEEEDERSKSRSVSSKKRRKRLV